ncbi:MAG: hypothetical protein L6R42_002048 [Xanthoria sp. 1 TBL-2021]|nr:MAG: hypothetical protein L6R42_002048 [Xanthoria sp. 1 TBL-2021]
MAPQSCPFCPFSDSNPYFLAQHVETLHPEDGVPSFVSRHFLEEDVPTGCKEATTVREAPSQPYIECECGEAIAASDFEDHAQLHSAEAADTAADMAEIVGAPALPAQLHSTALNRTAGSVEPTVSIPMAINSPGIHQSANSSKPRQASRAIDHGSQITAKDRLALLLGSNVSRKKRDVAKHRNAKRLGEAELGPYAHEDQMPAWLQRQLERGAKVTILNQISHQGQLVRLELVANETRGVLSVLAQLCEQDNMLAKVYLCHPGVQHVFKMAKEGGFCGYRNIQMMISYVQAARSRGHELFPGRLPSVLDLQELIESAWDRGINPAGKVETGGIRGTRKYIGTPEAQTLLTSLDIGCEASAFNDTDHRPVHEQVYDYVEQYFIDSTIPPATKVRKTSLAPIYFQHQGHSLTIVGLEVRKSGSRNLLVFDPSFKPSPGIQRLIGAKFRAAAPEKLLKAYRRGDRYLGKHSSFELLKLCDRISLGAGWDEL